MTNNPLISLNKLLLTLNTYEFATLAYLIGIILCNGLNFNEQQSLGNFFNLLGEVMQTIGSQGQNLNENSNDYNISDIKELLKNKINNLDELINNFKKL